MIEEGTWATILDKTYNKQQNRTIETIHAS